MLDVSFGASHPAGVVSQEGKPAIFYLNKHGGNCLVSYVAITDDACRSGGFGFAHFKLWLDQCEEMAARLSDRRNGWEQFTEANERRIYESQRNPAADNLWCQVPRVGLLHDDDAFILAQLF